MLARLAHVAPPPIAARGLSRWAGGAQFPTFVPTSTLAAFRQEWADIEPGARLEEAPEARLAGRLHAVRAAGSKLLFLDLVGGAAEDTRVQVIVEAARLRQPELGALRTALRRGDVVGVEGFPGASNKGELSLIPHTVRVLAPCEHDVPKHAVSDPETRGRNRPLDLLANADSRARFVARAAAVRAVRGYLEAEGFLEVETPVLAAQAGGAAATPFATHLDALDQPMFLRIAPELYLKRLVVGGLDRVFELGRVFRNEGVSLTHNPEFTMVEFYEAYADLETLMGRAEGLLRHVASAVGSGEEFQQPFRRLSALDALAAAVDGELPDPADASPAAVARYEELLAQRGVDRGGARTAGQLFDRLFSAVVEPQCQQPTIVFDYPVIVSPLARERDGRPGVAARFEVFAAGMELCNAYEELNDPDEQRRRFQLQREEREGGDAEAHPYDEDYCRTLEYGLPPTGGFGLGVDRLVMLLTGASTIKDVVLFPAYRSA